MADFPAPQTTAGALVREAPVTATILVYALFGVGAVAGRLSAGSPLVAPLFGVLGIVGLIIAYAKRDDARGTWVASHLRCLTLTFWYSLLWAIEGSIVFIVLGLVLVGLLLGPLIWGATSIWVLYR